MIFCMATSPCPTQAGRLSSKASPQQEIIFLRPDLDGKVGSLPPIYEPYSHIRYGASCVASSVTRRPRRFCCARIGLGRDALYWPGQTAVIHSSRIFAGVHAGRGPPWFSHARRPPRSSRMACCNRAEFAVVHRPGRSRHAARSACDGSWVRSLCRSLRRGWLSPCETVLGQRLCHRSRFRLGSVRI